MKISGNLSDVLTADLLERIVRVQQPWPKEGSLDFRAVADLIFDNPKTSARLFNVCLPALKLLSTKGLSQVPDLMTFLPPPESKQFPEQALGMQLLLDQGPRGFEGVDTRWRASYFDVISINFAHQLWALPRELRPDSKERWLGEVGASFDYWVVTKCWFQAPFIHSNSIRNHEIIEISNEEWRVEVEKHSGKIDPHRATKEKDSMDTFAFPRVIRAGPPKQPELKIEDFTFWFLWVLDVHVHTPIINEFERYPYRNASIGRESTEEEKAWIVKTDHFAELDLGSAEEIREDVLAGRWTPLKALFKDLDE